MAYSLLTHNPNSLIIFSFHHPLKKNINITHFYKGDEMVKQGRCGWVIEESITFQCLESKDFF